MANKKKYLWLIIFCLLLHSCFQSNSISICIETQEIKSCNSKGINRIYITNDSTDESYRIEWEKKENAPTTLNLNAIPNGYFITTGWNKTKLKSTKISLKANTKYTLERSQGDASSYKIKIYTNEQGVINNSDKTNCIDK